MWAGLRPAVRVSRTLRTLWGLFVALYLSFHADVEKRYGWIDGWVDGCIGLSVLVAYWTLGVVGCLVSTVAQV